MSEEEKAALIRKIASENPLAAAMLEIAQEGVRDLMRQGFKISAAPPPKGETDNG